MVPTVLDCTTVCKGIWLILVDSKYKTSTDSFSLGTTYHYNCTGTEGELRNCPIIHTCFHNNGVNVECQNGR